MGRLSGYSGKQIARAAESVGWRYQRTTGDHMVFRKPGARMNLSIPDHREVSQGTLAKIVRTMGLTTDEFIAMVKK